ATTAGTRPTHRGRYPKRSGNIPRRSAAWPVGIGDADDLGAKTTTVSASRDACRSLAQIDRKENPGRKCRGEVQDGKSMLAQAAMRRQSCFVVTNCDCAQRQIIGRKSQD